MKYFSNFWAFSENINFLRRPEKLRNIPLNFDIDFVAFGNWNPKPYNWNNGTQYLHFLFKTQQRHKTGQKPIVKLGW